jgi:hypothetical protein
VNVGQSRDKNLSVALSFGFAYGCGYRKPHHCPLAYRINLNFERWAFSLVILAKIQANSG